MIKVNTEKVMTLTSQMHGEITRLKEIAADMETRVTHSKAYWVGAGGDRYRQIHDQKKEQINTALEVLSCFPARLTQIAGNYEKNEEEMIHTITGL